MVNFYEFPFNLICTIAAIIIAAAAGYSLRSAQLAKKNKEIAELEKEMLQAHAEILDTQREFASLEARVRDLARPVIPMKPPASKDDLGQKDGSGDFPFVRSGNSM